MRNDGMKSFIGLLGALILGAALGAFITWRNMPTPTVTREVVVKHDTIVEKQPTPTISSGTIRTETAKLAVAANSEQLTVDSAQLTANSEQPTVDSVLVEIPITQRLYEGRNYRAFVSGYNPRLDSISIYAESKTITERIEVAAKRKHWGIGLQVGYGYTPQGFQPFVGVGVTYNLIGF